MDHGTTKEYSNDKVVLRPLSEKDAYVFHNLYTLPEVTANFDENPFLENEHPIEFTKRIISACERIYTIRLKESPGVIIGDCALHSWKNETHEMVIGGALHPGYWGKGLMQAAFNILETIAREEFDVKILTGITRTQNLNAIRLVEKMGFQKYVTDGKDTVMRKEL